MFSNNLIIVVIILIYLILLYLIILFILKIRTKMKIKNIIRNINNDIDNNISNNNKINKIKLTFKKSFIDGQILYINLFCDDKLLLKEVTDLINKNQIINLKSNLNNFYSHSHPHIHTY